MPRQARKKSNSGIYHIMLRGINRQQIFEDDEDRDRFIEILKTCKEKCGYVIYAYCLMGNHVHLLLKEGAAELAQIIKRIAGSYAYWYNWKYCRCGHLFQDRFKSEPVEDDGYFLVVLRYIHQNPVKAKLCLAAEEYVYSSMRDYLTVSDLVDTEVAYSLITKERFLEYHYEENTDMCLEVMEQLRLSEREAKDVIFKITNCKSVAEFQALNLSKRDEYIQKLRKNGLSIRQISRLTGVSKKIVERNT